MSNNPIYPSDKARELYDSDPHDQLSIRDGPGLGTWAGLYVEKHGGTILVEYPDQDEIVQFDYEREDEMRNAWSSLELALEVRYPQNNDVIVLEMSEGGECLVLQPPQSGAPWEVRNPEGEIIDDAQVYLCMRVPNQQRALQILSDGDVPATTNVWVRRDDDWFLTDLSGE